METHLPPFSPVAEPAAHTAERVRDLVRAALAMAGELDQRTLLGGALSAAQRLLTADGASFWAPGDEQATCQLATGSGADALRDTRVPLSVLLEEGAPARTLAVPILSGERTVGYLRVARTEATRNGAESFDDQDRDVLTLLAESTAAALRLAGRMKAADRSSDLKLIQELSREIGSSLDLDRVLRTAVNIAARALTFDLGALALYEGGKCDVRAVAGASAVDSGTEEMQDLAFRAAWAAGTGEMFYLSDREAPSTDTERIFLQFFDGELAKIQMSSGLYLPLRDEEGIVGILLFEAKRAEFASERERDIAMILANLATVAIRNAKLYSQVPLAEALGAISAKRAAFFSIPKRKRNTALLVGVAVLAALTLIRWPLRVVAAAPVLQPWALADVRPMVAGTVDRVYVREGQVVSPGDPVAQLRDVEARAARASAEATRQAAARLAAAAASRGDAAGQRLQRLLEASARAELALRDEELSTLTLRAPAGGQVLSTRPELKLDARLQAGEIFVQLGRTDTLDLVFGVDQQDIDRVRVGNEVRLRVDALPQRTVSGRVLVVGALPVAGDTAVRYPVRAAVANSDGLLKPGMRAHARVLTAPASIASRMLRTPSRVLRLLWWRMWSWI